MLHRSTYIFVIEQRAKPLPPPPAQMEQVT